MRADLYATTTVALVTIVAGALIVYGAIERGATIPPFGDWPRVLQVFAAVDAAAVLLILWLFFVTLRLGRRRR